MIVSKSNFFGILKLFYDLTIDIEYKMSSTLFTLPIINTTDYFQMIKVINAKRNFIKQDQIKQNPPASFSLRDSNFDYTGTTLQE